MFDLIISCIVLSILYYLNKKSNVEIKNNENKQVTLRLNKFYLYFGYFSLIIGLIFSFMISINKNDLLFLIILLILFFGSGSLLVLFYKKHKVEIYDDKIEVFNLRGNKKTIFWTELSKVHFSFFKGTLILVDNNGEKINIHQHIVGFKTIIQIIKNKTIVNIDNVKQPY